VIRRKRVDSSVIAAVGYDRATEVLEVEFHSGKVYIYLDVPPEEHRALLAADSIGRYFNQEIRTSYSTARIRG
jgi:hypothetical protein